jgi:hypothetical protein
MINILCSLPRFLPYNTNEVPCLLCGKKWVPELILSTVEPPAVSRLNFFINLILIFLFSVVFKFKFNIF